MSHSPYLDLNRDLDTLRAIVDDYQRTKLQGRRSMSFGKPYLDFTPVEQHPIADQGQLAVAS